MADANQNLAPAERIDLVIARAVERAHVELRAMAEAELTRQNRSFAQLHRRHAERCAAARYRFRKLLGGRR